jgi:hypothetical protein
MGILRGRCARFDGVDVLPSKRSFPSLSRGICQIKSKLAQFKQGVNYLVIGSFLVCLLLIFNKGGGWWLVPALLPFFLLNNYPAIGLISSILVLIYLAY